MVGLPFEEVIDVNDPRFPTLRNQVIHAANQYVTNARFREVVNAGAGAAANGAYQAFRNYGAQRQRVRGPERTAAPPPPMSAPRRFGPPGLAQATRQVGQMRTLGKMGVYRRGSKPPKSNPYTLAIGNDETVHSISQPGSVAWFGYSVFKREQVLDQIATHILKRILLRFNDNLVSYSAVPDCCKEDIVGAQQGQILHEIIFYFRAPTFREAIPGDPYLGQEVAVSVDQVIGHTDLKNKTFTQISDSIRTRLHERTKIGYKLYQIDVYKTDHTQHNSAVRQFFFKLDGLDKAKVDFKSRMNVKVQNVTPSDTANMNLNAVDANALKGMIYDFSSPTPRFHRQFLDEYPQADPVSKLQATDTHVGVLNDAALRINADPASALDGPFKQPIYQTRGIFSNVSGQQHCVIKPGGYTSVVREFTYKGRLGDFLLGLYGGMNGPYPTGKAPTIDQEGQQVYATTGESTMICLQHMMRNTTLDDLVSTSTKLQVSVRYDYHFSYTPRKNRPMPRKLYHQ